MTLQVGNIKSSVTRKRRPLSRIIAPKPYDGGVKKAVAAQ